MMHRVVLHNDVVRGVDEDALIEIGDDKAVKGNIAAVSYLDPSCTNAIAEDGHDMPRIRAYDGRVASRSRGTSYPDIFMIRPGFDVQGIATADLAYTIVNRAPRV